MAIGMATGGEAVSTGDIVACVGVDDGELPAPYKPHAHSSSCSLLRLTRRNVLKEKSTS